MWISDGDGSDEPNDKDNGEAMSSDQPGHIRIGENAASVTYTIRPWTREERLYWYQTGRNLYRPEWMYQTIINNHPELPELNRSWDNLYGGSFD